MSKEVEPSEAYSTVIETSKKAHALIIEETKHIKPSQQMIIYGRIVLLLFHNHFRGIEFMGHKQQAEAEQKNDSSRDD